VHRPLLIHDDQDTIVSHHVAVNTHGRIPLARIVTISGGTHLIVATHGLEIGQAVAKFIEEKGT